MLTKAREAGIPAGLSMETRPEVLSEWISRGSQFATVGEDLSFLRYGATQALAECKRCLEKSSG